jgi:hypothetical protein
LTADWNENRLHQAAAVVIVVGSGREPIGQAEECEHSGEKHNIGHLNWRWFGSA